MLPDNAPLPPIVSRSEWIAARKALLAKEKAVTRARDAVAAERRRLPMVRIDKDYVFDGPRGKIPLLGMFENRRLLYIHHFMWIDAKDDFCPSCAASADMNFTPPILAQLHAHDVTFACVARAPIQRIEAFKARRGWSFPFYSSAGNEFNTDFRVTLDAAKAPIEFNYRGRSELLQTGLSDKDLTGDWPGNSVFLRHGDDVFHTYSAYARGLDQFAMPYNFLDLTPYGRQEAWEDSPAGWPQRPTYAPSVASD